MSRSTAGLAYRATQRHRTGGRVLKLIRRSRGTGTDLTLGNRLALRRRVSGSGDRRGRATVARLGCRGLGQGVGGGQTVGQPCGQATAEAQACGCRSAQGCRVAQRSH